MVYWIEMDYLKIIVVYIFIEIILMKCLKVYKLNYMFYVKNKFNSFIIF